MDYLEQQYGKLRSMTNKHENTTISSEQQRTLKSNLTLISSDHLTPEMAVNYLYKWKTNPRLTEPLLQRLFEFCMQRALNYLPTIIYIMSLQDNVLFQHFCERIAGASISHYELVRWSYSTYLDSDKKKTQSIISKLDSSMLQRFSGQATSLQAINRKAELKLQLSNYTQHCNFFFEKLFRIPQKLKKYDKLKRNDKLRQILKKLSEKFFGQKSDYLDGVAFPIGIESSVVMRINIDQCFTFSTKERVPFKLVVQTIGFKDAFLIREGKQPQFQVDTQQPQKASHLLPQSYFGREWRFTKAAISQSSIFGKIQSYKIRSFMVKSGDDLRQQYMAMQLIGLFNQIFQKENIKIWMRPYVIVPYSSDSGLIQFIDDTRTISYLKEKSNQRSLKNIYMQIFGSNWQSSITNFIQSLAGYSLIQYYFDIKDRHNNNILIDSQGHVIHIDFSFMLSSSPGNMNFQRSPFKLTKDYLQIMQGHQSDIFQHFKLLFFLGVKYLRKYKKDIMEQIMMMTQCPGLKCFIKFDQKRLQSKFLENTTDTELEQIVNNIIMEACNSYTTSQYDIFQWFTNKIAI